MFNRWIEDGLLQTLEEEGVGCIAFSPLAQGLLTAKYLHGIPESSRVVRGEEFSESMLTERNLANVRALDRIAQQRGQSLAQMAIAWVLRKSTVTSALIGASRWSQIEECLGAVVNLHFTDAELAAIDQYAVDGGINIWSESSANR
jgi:L-glyceraldehyde 3-phosphate reductase